ncbi:hypothetical protein AMJ50_01040 [Parcubacteria bacterium DG_74_3]|nr:MAG: hypothetical protein AMJ50_01040 [Parcubacteria bacterium DG_74_3]
MPKIYVGTSGWVYDHWKGVFYSENLKHKDKLKYFSQQFKTTEINYSFYHLPRPSTYQKWYSQTPRDFLFAVKVSRFITHIKRLKGMKNAWQKFLDNALNLKEKLGPFLFQFPPSFQATEENLKRLEEFLKLVTRNKRQETSKKTKESLSHVACYMSLRLAFEFRHKSWCDEKIYKLLKKYDVAWVIADSSRYPRTDMVTTEFVYIRLHGPKAMFSSRYTKKELKGISQKIKKWLNQRLDIYVYFNNDLAGYAIENARELLRICKQI